MNELDNIKPPTLQKSSRFWLRLYTKLYQRKLAAGQGFVQQYHKLFYYRVLEQFMAGES